MQDAVAIVTGGGASVVRKPAARGVRCVIKYAASRDEAEALAAEVWQGAITVQANIVEDAACRALAGAIVMLLDPDARAITGEVMLLDAGAHLDVGLSRRPGREI